MVTAPGTGYKVTKVIGPIAASPLVTSCLEGTSFAIGHSPLAFRHSLSAPAKRLPHSGAFSGQGWDWSQAKGESRRALPAACPGRRPPFYNLCMADPSPNPPSTSAAPAAHPPASANEPTTDFHIGDEFGTAKRNLPPARIVVLSIALVAIIVGSIAFHERARPQGAGSIRLVSAAEVPGQTPPLTLAAVTFTLRNAGEKPLWIRTLKARVVAGNGQTYEDSAASAVDLDRYYQMFPALKDSSEPPLSPETKLMPGDERRGTIVVSFPLAKEAFDQRKALTVVIQPYDQPVAIVLQ